MLSVARKYGYLITVIASWKEVGLRLHITLRSSGHKIKTNSSQGIIIRHITQCHSVEVDGQALPPRLILEARVGHVIMYRDVQCEMTRSRVESSI